MTTMTQRLTPVLCLSFALAAGACSDDDNGKPPPKDSSPQDTVGGTEGSVPDQGPPADAMITARFCGSLEDEAGAPVEGGDVVVCNEHECHTGTAGVTGAFCVHVNKAGDYLFHAAEKEIGSKHFGDMMFPTELSEAELQSKAKVDLGTIVMPLLGAAQNLDPAAGGTLELGAGKLTVPVGATVLPPLTTEAKVALAVLDAAKLHAQLAAAVPGGKTAEAAFVIVPIGVTFSSPVSFELPAPQGLAAGTALEIHRVHDEQGKLVLNGEATVDGSGKLIDVSGKGLTGLGVMVFVKK
jgi:hypothetical protein